MHVLFLSRWYPFPPNNGSRLRVYHLLRGLAQRHTVSLVSFTEPSEPPDLTGLRPICAQVQTVERRPFQPDRLRARLGFLSPTPRSVIDTYAPEMEAQIARAVAARPDVVIASQFDMAVYHRAFRGLPALLEEIELGVYYDRWTQAVALGHKLRAALTWAKHRRYLARLLRDFRACTVAAEEERQIVCQHVLGSRALPVVVVPNGVDLASYTRTAEASQPPTLIFTGSFRYFANHEAMVWFVGQVLPRIQAIEPATRLVITGDHANLPLPPAPNVTLTGLLPDVRPWLARAWVSVVPIQQGGGTRLKILEAMASGVPVVTTTKGAQGLAARHEEHLLIADGADAFAAAVLHLLHDPTLRQRLADNAYALVRERYDWSAILPSFLDLVEGVARS